MRLGIRRKRATQPCRALGQGAVLQRPALYLPQGRVPSFVRPDDPPELADELAAQRRRDSKVATETATGRV